MQNVINSVKGTALGFAGFLTPILKESKFKETGVVTPQEFVIAGDHLVHTCPTWEWARGDESKTKSYLPKNKQYLITKKVPCLRRCKQIENCEVQENIVEDEDGDEGWVETHHLDSSLSPLCGEMSEVSFEDNNSKNENQKNDYDTDNDDDDEGEAVDMDSFVENGFLEDNDSIAVYSEQKREKKLSVSSISDNVIKTRTYDLHITYDKFYQTPRLWLYGYSENQIPLNVEEMYEDVSQDYAKKTVTMEIHPHIPGPQMASIHPCKHADIMKKLIQTVTEGGKDLGVHMYLIIFLKFVQSVIPTIDYDYTQNINL
ncbi:Autophagy-related protein 3,Autophagy-related protein 3, N-terminal,Autophagy-related protein 3, C- [Cinara cedri]|uniref:Ubiquitin-like-conjugating enzyme ATG3 n=1 Tax=Cinara cedri TaxID=506608 RepID=A0A5E4NIJ6_9HEMI|nr:Autophagy-related protein 3,Autophagy-related protein 3, N-terminal,Autophagy-related protein 3, C- [Cinara cedri]